MTVQTPDDATEVIHTPIFSVSVRKVGKIERFATVHHPGAVAIVAHDEKFVYLTKQFRPAVGHEVIELPAGTRDVGEEEADVTAIRELEEEIGKHPRDLNLMTGFYSSPGYTDEYNLLFRAWNLEDVEKPEADDSGTIEVFPVPLKRIDTFLHGPGMTAKTIVGLVLLKQELRMY